MPKALLIAAVLAVMEQDPDIAGHFITKLSARMQQLAAELRAVGEQFLPPDVDGHTADQRLRPSATHTI